MNLPADRPLTQTSATFMAPSNLRITTLSFALSGNSNVLRYQQMPCHCGLFFPATSASTRAVWGRVTVSHLAASKEGEAACDSSARRNCQFAEKFSGDDCAMAGNKTTKANCVSLNHDLSGF